MSASHSGDVLTCSDSSGWFQISSESSKIITDLADD